MCSTVNSLGTAPRHLRESMLEGRSLESLETVQYFQNQTWPKVKARGHFFKE